MASMFYLACWYCVLRGSQSPRAPRWYVGAIIACWLGMATKEIVVTAPLVVLLYDRIFLAPSWASLARRRWRVYAGMLVAVVALAYATTDTLHERPDFLAGFGFRGVTPWQYLSSQPGVILHYLRLTLWPVCLSIDYNWPVARTPGDVMWPGVAVGTLVLASLVALTRWPQVGFLGVAFFLVLAPTSSIMQNGFLAVEHRMYLPLAALIVLGVVGVHALASRALPDAGTRRLLEGGALSVAVLALTLRTSYRNRDYHDAIALWSSVVECVPDNSRGHFSLGVSLMDGRRVDEAMVELRRALELQPTFADARFVLGNTFMIKGDVDRAIAEYERTIRMDRRHFGAHNNLAVIFDKRGDREVASAHYRQAIKADPRNGLVQSNYAALYARAGDCARAVPRYRKAIRLDPSSAAAHLGLGLCLDQQGETAAAITAFRRAVRLGPDQREAGKELVRLLATAEPKNLRNPAEAVRLGENLIAGSGGADVESLLVLATAYAEAGRPQDAVATAQRAYDRAVAGGEESEVREATDALGRYRAGTPSRQ